MVITTWSFAHFRLHNNRLKHQTSTKGMLTRNLAICGTPFCGVWGYSAVSESWSIWWLWKIFDSRNCLEICICFHMRLISMTSTNICIFIGVMRHYKSWWHRYSSNTANAVVLCTIHLICVYFVVPDPACFNVESNLMESNFYSLYVLVFDQSADISTFWSWYTVKWILYLYNFSYSIGHILNILKTWLSVVKNIQVDSFSYFSRQ